MLRNFPPKFVIFLIWSLVNINYGCYIKMVNHMLDIDYLLWNGNILHSLPPKEKNPKIP